MRSAHRKAVEGQKGTYTSIDDTDASEAIEPVEGSDRPINPVALSALLREGLLVRTGKTISIAPIFFHRIWQLCSDEEISAGFIVLPEEGLNGKTLAGALLGSCVLMVLRKEDWNLTDLTALINEAGHHLFQVFLNKALQIGIFSASEGNSSFSEWAFKKMLITLTRNLSENPITDPSRTKFYRRVYESLRDVIKAAIENIPQEDARYLDILALFVFSVAYDNATLDYYVGICDAWWRGTQPDEGGRLSDV